MTKAIITKEQAEAIESLRKLPYYDTDDRLLVSHAETLLPSDSDCYTTWGSDAAVLNGMSLDTFARAILNGYDIQRTREEEVKTYFWLYDEIGDDYEEGIRKGALRMLEIYGIKVEGVNA